MKAKWFSTLLAVAMLMVAVVPFAGAAPAAAEDGPIFAGRGDDNLSHPLGDEQAALKAKAMKPSFRVKAMAKSKKWQKVNLLNSVWKRMTAFL